STQTMWLLSDFDSTLSISEPEPLPGNNKIWVYYSAVKIDTAKPYLKRIFQLRRCETPMNIVTSVEDEREIPAQFTLSQNYPNPFNPSTIIKFEIERKSLVTLKIYDILGKEVAVLINEEKYPGKYRVKFNAGRLAGGIYFYTLKTAGFYQTKKLVLLK
ncbi:MAG: T9SS type A sorting domain-containing protein, partial [Bacteroidota bacterium]